MNRYEFKVTGQGTRMDGEKLFGLVVFDTHWKKNGLPSFLKSTSYDELTQYELDYIKERMS